MSTNLTLALIVAALQVGDAVTTIRNLRTPGGREHNPLVRALIERFGMVPALVGKGIVASVIAVVLALYVPGQATTVGLALLAAFYAFIVAGNIRRRG